MYKRFRSYVSIYMFIGVYKNKRLSMVLTIYKTNYWNERNMEVSLVIFNFDIC